MLNQQEAPRFWELVLGRVDLWAAPRACVSHLPEGLFPTSSSQRMGASRSTDNLLCDLGQVPVHLWALPWLCGGWETWVHAGLSSSDTVTTMSQAQYFRGL